MTHGESIQTALEMIPKGEFLLTAAGGGRTNGVLVNFVGQCANNPPMLAVSAVKGQVLSPLIWDSRRFVLSIVSDHNRSMARRFDQSSIENEDAFLGLPIERTPSGVPVLSDSDAWFDMSQHSPGHTDSHLDRHATSSPAAATHVFNDPRCAVRKLLGCAAAMTAGVRMEGARSMRETDAVPLAANCARSSDLN